jgi:hypothetical protein
MFFSYKGSRSCPGGQCYMPAAQPGLCTPMQRPTCLCRTVEKARTHS